MFEGMTTVEIVKLILPLIIFQLALQIYCIVNILRKGVANLNKVVWIIIVLFVNLFGPIAYLIIGRKKYSD